MERLIFTKHFDSNVLRIITECQVVIPYDPFRLPAESENLLTYSALWDTGATITCVSSRVVADLRLIPLCNTNLALASGSMETEEYAVDLILPNGLRFPSVRVVRTEGSDDVTIGMDLISQLDFAITHPEGKTLFSFQTSSQTSVDFSKR